jgi:hypothetical protein
MRQLNGVYHLLIINYIIFMCWTISGVSVHTESLKVEIGGDKSQGVLSKARLQCSVLPEPG